MVVTLEEVKLYLRVDGDEENTLITNFISSAEEICEDILRQKIFEFNPVPETIKQAVLYVASQFYEARENIDMQKTTEMAKRILFAYRKDVW